MSSGEKTPPISVTATPVHLAGLPKEQAVPVKRKFFDESWPPHRPVRPAAYHKISAKTSIASYNGFMTFPAALKAVTDDTCSGLVEEVGTGEVAKEN